MTYPHQGVISGSESAEIAVKDLESSVILTLTFGDRVNLDPTTLLGWFLFFLAVLPTSIV